MSACEPTPNKAGLMVDLFVTSFSSHSVTMVKTKKPRKASLRSSLVKDLRTKVKDAKKKVREYQRDLKSLGVGRKKKAK